jgi:tetratricopeptide (TPR) repeat protein
MRRCGISRGVGACLCAWFALLAVSACGSRDQSPVDGIVVFDELVPLVRGERHDSAQHEFEVSAEASYVAFVEEEDCDVTLSLATSPKASPPVSVAVNNSMYGESLEVATLDAPRGSRLVLRLESAHDTDVPCKSRVRLLRYDDAAVPRVAARLDAFRAWTRATDAARTRHASEHGGLSTMESAIAYFESPEGDPWLAAWGRLVCSDMRYYDDIDYQNAVRDARLAQAAFTGLKDARNAARARFALAITLIEVETDKNARNPTAAEAAREVEPLLATVAVDPALSEVQRARAVNFRGNRAMNLSDWQGAARYYRESLDVFTRLGHRQGQQMQLSNLGVVYAEMGDFQTATRYFDPLIAQIDQVAILRNAALYMLNAARADTDAGHVDRAIARLLQALEWSRQLKDEVQEGRCLHALGRAYWARGDLPQAATFFQEALRLRRTLNDPIGVMASLRYVGLVAREEGRLDEALKLHREAVELSISNDLKLRGLLDLALDYAAQPDYRKAISTCREALALPSKDQAFYKRYHAQLALGDFLLSQAKPTAADIAEAESLSVVPLDAALRRYDVTMELAARHLRARALAARASWKPAREEYERAVTLIFRYSSTSPNPELQAYALAREHATFRDYLDLLMRDASGHEPGALHEAGSGELDALRMIEWARAAHFSSSGAPALDGKSRARVDSLLAQMAGKRVRVAALLDQPGDQSHDIERLQFEMAHLRAEIDRLLAQPVPAGSAGSTSSLGAPALPALATGVTQWSYAIGHQRVYLWVRDGAGVRTAVLPLAAAGLERRLASRQSESELQQLAPLLVPREALRGDTSRLEIVAAGALVRVPFAALLPPDGPAVTMIGSVFRTLRPEKSRARPLRFVGIAASQGPASARGDYFSGLGATTSEARSIAALFRESGKRPAVKLLLGPDGTVNALESSWRDGVDVLHIATHGLADLRQPMTSLLMLPAKDASGNSTYLTAGQVQAWRGDVDLVYLSACETAIGPARFADGMPGLQRAFLRAGARGVIATMWPVEDVYAGQFATDFYRRYTAGVPAPRALADTQRAWMQPAPGLRASEQVHRRMTAWAHAYYAR